MPVLKLSKWNKSYTVSTITGWITIAVTITVTVTGLQYVYNNEKQEWIKEHSQYIHHGTIAV